MLILRAFYGSQYGLLEVSIATISIILIGMCFLSVLFGVFLCIAFEGPCLKFQRFVLRKLKQKREQYQVPSTSHLFEENRVKITATTTLDEQDGNHTILGLTAGVSVLK